MLNGYTIDLKGGLNENEILRYKKKPRNKKKWLQCYQRNAEEF